MKKQGETKMVRVKITQEIQAGISGQRKVFQIQDVPDDAIPPNSTPVPEGTPLVDEWTPEFDLAQFLPSKQSGG